MPKRKYEVSGEDDLGDIHSFQTNDARGPAHRLRGGEISDGERIAERANHDRRSFNSFMHELLFSRRALPIHEGKGVCESLHQPGNARLLMVSVLHGGP